MSHARAPLHKPLTKQAGNTARPAFLLFTFSPFHLFTYVVCAVAVLIGEAACAQPANTLPPARQREVLQQAIQAYDEAAAQTDPARRTKLYDAALAGFLALRESGIRSAALEYNLGNTHFRLGDLGRAILHYRRAERRAGGEARVQANLRYARGRVEPQIPASGETRLTRQLLFWHYRTTLTVRAWIMLILAAIAWPLLFLWLQRRRNGLLIAGSIGVIASFALGASVLWQMHDQAARPAAVTVAAEEYLRLGRGANADRALKQPLGPGVELRILQQRGDWVEVRLPNDQTGWLPQGAVERV